jgi:hypothetical protein
MTTPIAIVSTAPIVAPAIVATAGVFDGVGDCVDDGEVEDAVAFASEAIK